MNVINNKGIKWSNIGLHVLVWFAYALFIYVMNLLTRPNDKFISSILFLLPFCITFYLCVFCLGLYRQWGAWWSLLSFFIVFAVMGSLGYIYLYFFLPGKGVMIFTNKDFNSFLQEALLGYVRYFFYAAFYYYAKEFRQKERQVRIIQEEKAKVEQEKMERELENALLRQQELQAQKEKIELEKENVQLEKEKLELTTKKLQLEFAFLRAQINPHFLHNTLNVLFSKALTYSPELADNILKLSRIMRYSLESLEYESGKVPVQKELENLQVLLDIHILRFGNTKAVNYHVEGEAQGQMLPPLSLLTIVENAFKYGDLKDPAFPLEIKVQLKPQEIYFSCQNKKKKNFIPLSSMSIGITNLSRRLDESFKGKYEMKATDELDFYKFELSIVN